MLVVVQDLFRAAAVVCENAVVSKAKTKLEIFPILQPSIAGRNRPLPTYDDGASVVIVYSVGYVCDPIGVQLEAILVQFDRNLLSSLD